MTDPSNPFGDPEETQPVVQNSGGGPPPFKEEDNYGQEAAPVQPKTEPEPFTSPQNYGQDDNYEAKVDTTTTQPANTGVDINKFVSQEQQNAIVYQAGTAAAQNAADKGTELASDAKKDYDAKTVSQQDQNEKPDTPMFILNCIRWFPLRFFAMIAGLLCFAFPIVDIFTAGEDDDGNKIVDFTTFFMFGYIMIFGVVIFFVESPTFALSRKFQLAMSFWFRLLSRTWGRAWFYIFVSFLCFGKPQIITATLFAGIYLFFIAILSFIFGRLSAKKYQRMYIFMAAGTEGDQLIGNLMRKFDELDTDQDGRLGAQDIVSFAKQAGRDLANAERHAIQTFLDESCNGYVSKEDWMKQWTTYNMNQRML